MPDAFEHWILDVMSGRSRGLGAALTRATLAAVEPAYAGVAAARNRRFDRGRKPIHPLPRPTISIGNLTTGGTGKTPAVQWLVRALIERDERPGILLRGYRKEPSASGSSDEEQLLRDSLGVPVVADADRVRGAATLLAAHSDVTVIVLDDGFQHRRVARDVDVVLIDATNPFGFGHVLPRGLLREPISGLARAHLVIVTRSDQATPETLRQIEADVRTHNLAAPIVRASHRLTRALQQTDDAPIASLASTRIFTVSGIGNPAAFERSLADVGMVIAGARRFADHHAYAEADVAPILAAAREAHAERVVITEKDWTKLERLEGVRQSPIPFVRAAMRLEFEASGQAVALATIVAGLKHRPL